MRNLSYIKILLTKIIFMSTRGAAGIVFNEKVYAVYNHCDSYPGGLGSEVESFVKSVQSKPIEVLEKELQEKFIDKRMTVENQNKFLEEHKALERFKKNSFLSIIGLGWEQLKKNLIEVEEIDEKVPPTKEVQDRYISLRYYNSNVSNQSPTDWYCLLRNIQGIDTFSEIIKGNLKHISNNADFFKDSLFCEWGYLINLDTMKFEVYRGFQKSPQEGNRFGQEKIKQDYEYYPCALVTEFPLNSIPEDWENAVIKNEEE